MIVMKFGGSSLESAGAIQQAACIVERQLNAFPVVVVSAMGKTTDRLLEAVQCAARGNSYGARQQTEALRRMHFQETRALLAQRAEPFLRESIAPLFRELELLLIEVMEGQPFTPEVQDRVLSFGERISSLIVAEAFRHLGIHAAQVDARKVIVTGDEFTHATPLEWDTYARLRRTVSLIARDRVVVMGGFIGATLNGVTTTLGRGGSDLTATLVGAGISADEIQIWTDVDGMLTCDPRVLGGGYQIREISYQEAQEMARCGAKVLCRTSIAPAVRQRIPIVIRNARRPEVEGTRVVPQAPSGIAKCVTARMGMAVVRLAVKTPGILSSITDGLAHLFAREYVAIELIQSHEKGISFAVENWPGLAAALRSVDQSVEISVEEDRAAVWLVGQNVAQGDAVFARAAKALQGMNVRLASQGSSSLSLGFAIPEDNLRAAMSALHREFFATPDPAAFVPRPADPARVPQLTPQAGSMRHAGEPRIVPAL